MHQYEFNSPFYARGCRFQASGEEISRAFIKLRAKKNHPWPCDVMSWISPECQRAFSEIGWSRSSSIHTISLALRPTFDALLIIQRIRNLGHELRCLEARKSVKRDSSIYLQCKSNEDVASNHLQTAGPVYDWKFHLILTNALVASEWETTTESSIRREGNPWSCLVVDHTLRKKRVLSLVDHTVWTKRGTQLYFQFEGRSTSGFCSSLNCRLRLTSNSQLLSHWEW